jgi:hypothetical protein
MTRLVRSLEAPIHSLRGSGHIWLLLSVLVFAALGQAVALAKDRHSGHVTMTFMACSLEITGKCNIGITIEGQITSAVAECPFRKLLSPVNRL